jgi:hypothetical protein
VALSGSRPVFRFLIVPGNGRKPFQFAEFGGSRLVILTPKPFGICTSEKAHKCWALLTSSMSGALPQTVEIVGQPEKQGLADLRGQAAPGRARGELAFDGREDGFDLRALPVWFFGKSAEHLIANRAVRDSEG